MKTDLEPWKSNLEPWKTIKTNLNHWKPIKTEMEPWKTNLEPSKLTWSCRGWLWGVQVVTGDSQEEVIIFRDKQTHMHHNIYIIAIITIIAIIATIFRRQDSVPAEQSRGQQRGGSCPSCPSSPPTTSTYSTPQVRAFNCCHCKLSTLNTYFCQGRYFVVLLHISRAK